MDSWGVATRGVAGDVRVGRLEVDTGDAGGERRQFAIQPVRDRLVVSDEAADADVDVGEVAMGQELTVVLAERREGCRRNDLLDHGEIGSGQTIVGMPRLLPPDFLVRGDR